MQRFVLNYGQADDYVVTDKTTGKVVFTDSSKVMCIAKCQELNGWFVNGSESTYGEQAKKSAREQSFKRD